MEAEKAILIILPLLFILFIVLIDVWNKKKRRNYAAPCYYGIICSLIFYYFLIPILEVVNSDSIMGFERTRGIYNSDTVYRFIINGDFQSYCISIASIAVFSLTFIYFYNFSAKKNIYRTYRFDRQYTRTLTSKLVFFCFCIGSLFFLLFFASFGGISRALSYAESMRNMSNSLVEMIGSAALFKILARLITVVPLLIVPMIREKIKGKKYYIIFYASLFLSIVFYLYNAGRAPLLIFAICLLYGQLSKKEHPWRIILIIGVFGIPVIDFLDGLFVYFGTGVLNIKSINYLNYINQFSVPFKNTLAMHGVVETYGFRYGVDFPNAIMNLIPGINFDPSYVNLSEYIRGINWKFLGGIPTDLITFCYMQLSFIGVFFFAAILGYRIQIVDYKLSLFEDVNLRDHIGGVLTLLLGTQVASVDPTALIKSQFGMILLLLIVERSSNRHILHDGIITLANKTRQI